MKCPETGLSINNKICKCDVCRSERAKAQRKYRKDNPQYLRRMNLKRHSLSLEEYNNMLKKQNFVCAVCTLPETDSNQHNVMSLSVDHDHKTGQIRGLLCHRCNRALGLLNDDPIRVQALVNYRKEFL